MRPVMPLLLATATLIGTGCSEPTFRPVELPAEVAREGEPPADLALALTVQPAADSREWPERYVLEPDWILRAGRGRNVGERTHPDPHRRLSRDEVRRIWWSLRDAMDIAPAESGVVTASAPDDPAVFILEFTADNRRGRTVIRQDDPDSSAIHDLLAALAQAAGRR